jgi:hypothetical protein
MDFSDLLTSFNTHFRMSEVVSEGTMSPTIIRDEKIDIILDI